MTKDQKVAKSKPPPPPQPAPAPRKLKLRFSPYAWAKLLYLRDRGGTEVGGFAVSAADDLLLVEDVILVRQYCTAMTVRFDDEAVADYFDRQVDSGLAPARFARIWVHTHPGNSAEPTAIDEETFARCFGSTDWAVMFILSKGGQVTARLQFNIGPRCSMELPVEIDFSWPFPASEHQAWCEEYRACVVETRTPKDPAEPQEFGMPSTDDVDDPWWLDDPWREESNPPAYLQASKMEDANAVDDQPF